MFENYSLRQNFAVRRALVVACSRLAFATALLTSGTALGQWEADRATARNLALEGNAALSIGDYTTAEDRFRRADALVHAPTLVVDHAKALIGLHRYVEAQERLELVIREGVADSAPQVWKRALQDAKHLVEEVKPKVAWVTISVAGSSNPEVSVDGVQVPVAALGVRRATDPGPHRIKASAPGFLSKEIVLPVSEGSERAVTLDLEKDPSAQQAETPPAVDARPRKKPANVEDNASTSSLFSKSTLGYTALAIGGAGLVAGTVTGIMFLSKQSELQSKCPDKDCHGQVSQSFIDQRNLYGTISPISIGVGLVSGVVGFVLLTSDKSDATPRTSATSTTLIPYLSLGRVGVEGSF